MWCMLHLHIASLGPRSGTTLLFEIVAASYAWEGRATHEMTLAEVPDRPLESLLTKHPGDLRLVKRALKFHSDLFVIIILRDPRDCVVSIHGSSPDRYWANMLGLRNNVPHYLELLGHPRLHVVQYEELVANPNNVQRDIEAAFPFLDRRAQFSEFHNIAQPGAAATLALREVRPVSTDSVGAWRNHLPRIKQQEEDFGPIAPVLEALGYDHSDWPICIADIKADRSKSPPLMSLQLNFLRLWRIFGREISFRLRMVGLGHKRSVLQDIELEKVASPTKD